MGRISLALAVALLVFAGCGRSNPVLGEWDLDRTATEAGAVLAVQTTQMEHLTFTRGGVTDGATEIEGSYVVEEGSVRFVRADGRGEHLITMLPDERIQVELPIGVTAVYKKSG